MRPKRSGEASCPQGGGLAWRHHQIRLPIGMEKASARAPPYFPAFSQSVGYTGLIHEQPEGQYPCYQVPLAADHDGYMVADKGERNLVYLEEAVAKYPKDGYYQFQMASTLRNLNRLRESLKYFRGFYRLAEDACGYRAGGVVLYLYTLLDVGAEECLDEAARIVEREERVLGDFPDFCFVCGLFI